MDPFAESIAKSIEEEVERRVNAKVSALLQYVSENYNISIKSLSKCVDVKVCMGITKSGKRCKNLPKCNGYCHVHQHMYVQRKHKSPEILRHTHSLPPLHVKGCPVCEKGKPLRDLVDCFGND